jgi:hypothetical protein
LVDDIETLRRAINVDKLDFWGMSYGTLVGSVYATMFPEFTGRMLLDGNVMPVPRKRPFAEGIAEASQKSLGELITTYARNRTSGISNPRKTYEQVLQLAKDGKLTAPTKHGKPFAMKLGMLQGHLQSTMIGGPKKQRDAFGVLESLQSETSREQMVVEILDKYCVIKGVPTWSAYNVCVGPGNTMEVDKDAHIKPFIEGIAVLGGDFVGRYLVDDALRAWHTASQRFSAPALSAFLSISSIFLWPAIPNPVPPIGNSETELVVTGNLYDASTLYDWSQDMAAAFSKGALVTWRGVGHCIVTPEMSAERWKCASKLILWLRGDEKMPRDGTICRKFD